jgi:hypothetical protein
MAAWKRKGVRRHDRLVRAMVKKRLRASFQSASSSQIRGLANMLLKPRRQSYGWRCVGWLAQVPWAGIFACAHQFNPWGLFSVPAGAGRAAHGVQVRAVDVTHSVWDYALENATEQRRRAAIG